MQGKLSAEQLNTFRSSFKLFDTSNKGSVTKEELAKLLERLGATPSDEELSDMIHEVTGVKGGDKITFDQFVEMMMKRDTMTTSEKEREIEEAFDVFDTHKKGYLNREEVKNVLGLLGESTSSLDALMKDVDLDNDGRLDLNDFKALMRSSGHIPVRRKED